MNNFIEQFNGLGFKVSKDFRDLGSVVSQITESVKDRSWTEEDTEQAILLTMVESGSDTLNRLTYAKILRNTTMREDRTGGGRQAVPGINAKTHDSEFPELFLGYPDDKVERILSDIRTDLGYAYSDIARDLSEGFSHTEVADRHGLSRSAYYGKVKPVLEDYLGGK